MRRSANNADLAGGAFGEGVDLATFGIEVAQRHQFRRNREVAEAVDLLSIGSALCGVDFDVVEVGSATAGKEEACGVAFELKVLQVVVVSREVEGNFVLAEERVPIANEPGVVAVRSVGVDGVVAHRDEEGLVRGRLSSVSSQASCSA